MYTHTQLSLVLFRKIAFGFLNFVIWSSEQLYFMCHCWWKMSSFNPTIQVLLNMQTGSESQRVQTWSMLHYTGKQLTLYTLIESSGVCIRMFHWHNENRINATNYCNSATRWTLSDVPLRWIMTRGTWMSHWTSNHYHSKHPMHNNHQQSDEP